MAHIEAKPIPPRIEFQPYDPLLPDVFQVVKQLIQAQLPDVDVEHIGSSSVPGLGGSNFVDIVIPAPVSKHQAIVESLKRIGLVDSPFRPRTPFRWMFTGSVFFHGTDYFTVVYVEAPDSEAVRRWLDFRDWLRSHPDRAREYENVKRNAMVTGAGSHAAYHEAKRPYIDGLGNTLKD